MSITEDENNNVTSDLSVLQPRQLVFEEHMDDVNLSHNHIQNKIRNKSPENPFDEPQDSLDSDILSSVQSDFNSMESVNLGYSLSSNNALNKFDIPYKKQKKSNETSKQRTDFRRILFSNIPENILCNKSTTKEVSRISLKRMKSFSIQSTNFSASIPKLPIHTPQEGPMPRVNSGTVIRLLNQEKFTGISDFVLVDCRFGYETKGGAIKFANRCRTRQAIKNLYENLVKKSKMIGNIAVIFYCEFSKNRSPTVARFFRQLDRLNVSYPKLSFPDSYILEGGYKGFWDEVLKFNVTEDDKKKEFFEPYGYVSMWDEKHRKQCLKKNKSMKKEWSKNILNTIL